jgi:hypothetical protein
MAIREGIKYVQGSGFRVQGSRVATGQFPKTRENVVFVRMQKGPKPSPLLEPRVLSPFPKGERQKGGKTGADRRKVILAERGMG